MDQRGSNLPRAKSTSNLRSSSASMSTLSQLRKPETLLRKPSVQLRAAGRSVSNTESSLSRAPSGITRSQLPNRSFVSAPSRDAPSPAVRSPWTTARITKPTASHLKASSGVKSSYTSAKTWGIATKTIPARARSDSNQLCKLPPLTPKAHRLDSGRSMAILPTLSVKASARPLEASSAAPKMVSVLTSTSRMACSTISRTRSSASSSENRSTADVSESEPGVNTLAGISVDAVRHDAATPTRSMLLPPACSGLPFTFDTPAFPRLMSIHCAGTPESGHLIQDAEMSFIAEGDSEDAFIEKIDPAFAASRNISSPSKNDALAVAEAKILEIRAECDRASMAARLVRDERDEARAERDGARHAYHRSQMDEAKFALQGVIRAGTEALEEEQGVRAIIGLYRDMMDSVMAIASSFR